MNHTRRTHILRFALAAGIVSSWFLLGVARGQDTTTTSTEHGQPTVTTQVHSGTVVYVSGNELVVKTDDGTIKDFNVPDSARVTVDGKSLNVHELQPGMRLTRTITTTTTPKTVQTIRTITGKVWHVNPPRSLILTLPEGNKQYKVPEGTMFDVNGTKESIFQIRKGMTVSATIIKETPETLVSSTRSVTGEAPPPPPTPPPPTPTMVGVLLIEQPAPASPPQRRKLQRTTCPRPAVMFLFSAFSDCSSCLRDSDCAACVLDLARTPSRKPEMAPLPRRSAHCPGEASLSWTSKSVPGRVYLTQFRRISAAPSRPALIPCAKSPQSKSACDSSLKNAIAA